MKPQLINETIELPQKYSITWGQTQLRDGLLIEAREITTITDPQSQDRAVAMGRELQAHLQEVEAARVELTAPLLEAQRRLMKLKQDHCNDLLIEKNRLAGLVSLFQAQEHQRVMAEEAARQEAVRARLAEEAEARRAAEAAQIAAQSASDDQQAMADIAAAQAEMLVEAAEQESRAVIVAPVPIASKATGASTKTELCFEVVDIEAMYKSRPDLCKPPEAKPSAIKAVCGPPKHHTKDNPNTYVPGLKLWWETKTSFRK